MGKIFVANWKMHKTVAESRSYIADFIPLVENVGAEILLAVPFTALWSAANEAAGSQIVVGAQNIDFHENGAFTGEISAEMVTEAGGKFVILGHSERRQLFYESSELVNLKIKAALGKNLRVIVCIGETLKERQANQVEAVLKSELLESLKGISADQMERILLAYEPIWAIGSNLAATPQDVLSAHRLCRTFLGETWGASTAKRVPILYGGSVKPDNARELIETPEVDGFLVGGASLSPESFSKIVHSQQALNYI